jgi:predicted porin
MTFPRKRILAALALAALGAPAFADSLTLYGVADVGLSVANFGNGRQTNLVSGAEDGSRIGFQGTEDLGGGYKALFKLESRVEFDTGSQSNAYLSGALNAALFRGLPAPVAAGLVPAIGNPARVANNLGAIFDRQAYLGLVTPIGALVLGRQYTPAYEVAHGADAFESGTAGSWMNLAYVNGNAVTPSLSLRDNNAIQYRLETPGGIIASLMLATEPGTGSIGVAKRAGSGNLIYRAHGIDAGIGYHTEQDQTGVQSLRSWTAGGSYELGKAKLFVGFLRATNDNPAIAKVVAPAIGPAYAAVLAQNARVDDYVATLGAQYRLGSGRIKASVSRMHNRLTSDADATLAAVGYDYALSKRTNLYATVAHVTNQSNSQAGLGGSGYLGGSTAHPGANATVLQLGLRQVF